MQQGRRGVGGHEGGDHGGDRRVGLARSDDSCHADRDDRSHGQPANDHRPHPPDHPPQQHKANHNGERNEDCAVAPERAQFLNGLGYGSGGGSLVGVEFFGANGGIERDQDIASREAFFQYDGPHHQSDGLAVLRNDHPRGQLVVQHPSLPLGGRARCQVIGIHQQGNRKAVGGRVDMFDGGEREHTVNRRMRFHFFGNAIERTQKRRAE